MCKASNQAALAQLGERQTEDLKAPCSIHGGGITFAIFRFGIKVTLCRRAGGKCGYALSGVSFKCCLAASRHSSFIVYRSYIRPNKFFSKGAFDAEFVQHFDPIILPISETLNHYLRKTK